MWNNLLDITKDFTPMLVICVVICYLCYWHHRPKNYPPGPRGIPLLGMLPFVGIRLAQNLKKWSKEYGAIMSVRLGPKDMVVLNDYESIKQVIWFYLYHNICRD